MAINYISGNIYARGDLVFMDCHAYDESFIHAPDTRPLRLKVDWNGVESRTAYFAFPTTGTDQGTRTYRIKEQKLLMFPGTYTWHITLEEHISGVWTSLGFTISGSVISEDSHDPALYDIVQCDLRYDLGGGEIYTGTANEPPIYTYMSFEQKPHIGTYSFTYRAPDNANKENNLFAYWTVTDENETVYLPGRWAVTEFNFVDGGVYDVVAVYKRNVIPYVNTADGWVELEAYVKDESFGSHFTKTTVSI